MDEDYNVPPTPRGASIAETRTLGRLHYLGCLEADPGRQATMLEACRLIVDLIQARRRTDSFQELYDPPHED